MTRRLALSIMETKHYTINPVFAKKNNLPASFLAIQVGESKKAVKLYGHGAMDPAGSCCACGRTLTHPGSILLGIGPECLGNWGARDIKMDSITEEDKKYLATFIRGRKVDGWIPKSTIKTSTSSKEEIHLPEGNTSLTLSTTVGKPVEIKQAKEWKGLIAITFPYSYETLQKVKSLEGRKWVPEGKYWTCPIKAYTILKLKEWGFKLDSKLEASTYGISTIAELLPQPKKLGDIGLKRELFPFQKEGVEFIESRKGRALIGDEMGLGKTIQALAYLQLHPEHRPAIILCPASLKLNWAKEIDLTMTKGIRTLVLQGKRPYSLVGADIIIINYDILTYWVKDLLAFKPRVVIGDECHYFKDNSAKRTKAVKLLCKTIPHVILLSGTPIMNRPIEIYNAISIINSSVVPSFMNYAIRYCGAVFNGFGWDFSGSSNTEELHKILTESIMIRRKKSDVLKDLPDKIHSFVPMTLSNIAEYNSIENDVIGYLKMTRGEAAADRASMAEIMVQIELLKQAAARGKLNAVIDWVKEFLESGEKLVLFGTHKFVIDRLMEEFGSVAVKIDGSSSMDDRNQAVEMFQNNPKIKLFNGNIKAAGVGLTLTASSNVGFIEYPWTPGELQQAADRCHRIGQKFTVNIYHLMVPGTIEEKIATLLDKKTKVIDSVLDGVETKQESLLKELMYSLTGK